jgi:xanthine dehydrogenase/oxidase
MGNELAKDAHDKLVIFVNGVRHDLNSSVDPSTSVSAFLRSPQVAVTSSKVGCGTGYCGACTVMVSKRGEDGVVIHRAINACITPVALVDHCLITTAEASGAILARVKESFAARGAAQCGFCSPGFVMRIYAELRNSHGKYEAGGRESMAHLLDGNLCRCTGYRPILEAAADSLAAPRTDYNDEGELIFPPWLQLNAPKNLIFQGPRCKFIRPHSLAGLREALAAFPEARLVGGGTAQEMSHAEPGAVFVSCNHVAEFREQYFTDQGALVLGQTVSRAHGRRSAQRIAGENWLGSDSLERHLGRCRGAATGFAV